MYIEIGLDGFNRVPEIIVIIKGALMQNAHVSVTYTTKSTNDGRSVRESDMEICRWLE
jgi:hypothetical protein